MVTMRKLSSRFRGVAAASLGLTLVAAASACASSPASQAGGGISLTVWGMDLGPGYQQAINQDLAQWKKIHPDITINWITKSYSVIQASEKLALSGPGSPDIIELVQGWPDAQLAAAGLLVNLDKYAKQYGWYSEFSPSTIALNSNTANGKYFGIGNLYSVSDTSTLVGYFYNKSLMARLGLTVPTTMAQFTHELAVAKAHGLIPMEQGNLLHTWDSFMVENMPPATLSDWIYGNGSSTVDTPQEVQGAQTLQTWIKDGYFQPGFISQSQNGGTLQPINAFLSGKSLFYGSADPTLYGNVTAAHQQGNVGFFIQPPVTAGAPLVTPGGADNPYAISTRCAHPAAAAEFLNFLLSEPAQLRVQPDSAFLPTDTRLGPNPALSNSLLTTTFSGQYAQVEKNGVVAWPDFSSLDYVTVMTALTDELASGRITPQDMLAQLQQDHTRFLASIGR